MNELTGLALFQGALFNRLSSLKGSHKHICTHTHAHKNTIYTHMHPPTHINTHTHTHICAEKRTTHMHPNTENQCTNTQTHKHKHQHTFTNGNLFSTLSMSRTDTGAHHARIHARMHTHTHTNTHYHRCQIPRARPCRHRTLHHSKPSYCGLFCLLGWIPECTFYRALSPCTFTVHFHRAPSALPELLFR